MYIIYEIIYKKEDSKMKYTIFNEDKLEYLKKYFERV